jgi:hypothetical protein
VCRLKIRVESTKVSLAFGLDGEAPHQQDVYAFLPVRRYGLNFVMQVRAIECMRVLWVGRIRWGE